MDVDPSGIKEVSPSRVTFGEGFFRSSDSEAHDYQQVLELGIVFQGRMTLSVANMHQRFSSGTAHLLPPGHTVSYAFPDVGETHLGWVKYWAFSDRRMLPEQCRRLPFPIPLSRALARQMRQLLDVRESRLPTRDRIAYHVAMQMLYQCMGEATLLGTRVDSVERAQGWIEERLDQPISLGEIATGAAMSKSHLISRFKQRLGVTPVSYMWTRRTERGIELLESTELSIRDIAERCGFRTAHHFSNRIKEVTGLTPTELRDRASQPEASCLKDRMDAGGV